MHHQVMTQDENAHFAAEGTCPRCQYPRLRAGINLKDGWWLCMTCDTWWQPVAP